MQAMAADFDAPTEKMEGIVPLLYQSGYFTIKDYNKLAELYTLDIPNGEIRIGLMRSLLPGYLAHNTLKGNTTIARMYLAIAGEIWTGPCVFFRNSFLLLRIVITRIMRTLPAIVLHHLLPVRDVCRCGGAYPKGRVDVVMRVAGKLYVIELKLGRSAEAAMAQINLKQYPERFSLSGLQVVKVGINFDVEKHTLGDWVIEE